MKISRDSIVPQLELGPRLGGAKQLFQRTGLVTRPITMFSAMIAAWSGSQTLRVLFEYVYQVELFGVAMLTWFPHGPVGLYMFSAVFAMGCWMIFDFTMLYPSEQSFNQEQAQRAERSPMKRDTEAIRKQVNELHERLDEMG